MGVHDVICYFIAPYTGMGVYVCDLAFNFEGIRYLMQSSDDLLLNRAYFFGHREADYSLKLVND